METATTNSYTKKRLAIWRPKTDLEVPPFSTEASG